MAKSKSLVLQETITQQIFLARGQKVILDADLAKLYGVPTKRFNEQVKRNKGRFPEDFMFQLTKEEADALRSQNATSKTGRGGRRYAPYVFTEHGAIMAANILNSEGAIEISVYVVRAFVKIREELTGHAGLARKIADMEKTYDHQFKVVFTAIRQLIALPTKDTPRIGFKTK
ncbi:MAG: DNA-binding protein [Deltaproteobacteria bacterium RIFOXYB12_FULL_58_9]|nr:MAG: DNA-binding protein [Deltaproteobacteria bacterium RIFOXYB12_FULL_58_9]